jgi:hypothetical protein
MKQDIVTAQDVAEATDQSVESVARDWHDIGNDQNRVQAEESSSDEQIRESSDD